MGCSATLCRPRTVGGSLARLRGVPTVIPSVRIRSSRRLAAVCALANTSDVTEAHGLAAHHYAVQLAVAGRVEEATSKIAEGAAHARREGNAMALAIWNMCGGLVHLAAGRLSAARASVESLPPPHSTGVTEPDILRTLILAEVSARADDRNLLQQMVNIARDAYPTGSALYVG